ncbi:MAG TPA: CHAT domain-containing tetratricopeptide repeat protein [Flavobacteriales bacterium]|nr:CHAT domain-containing tetratricopeptide repeat protein [Flavobacteriales bacterium]
MISCGTPGHEAPKDRQQPNAEVPTLKDTLAEMLSRAAMDSAGQLIAARYQSDSLNWSAERTAAAWHAWAIGYVDLMLDVDVRIALSDASQRLSILTVTGIEHATTEKRLLSRLYKESSKYLNRLGRKDEALQAAHESWKILGSVNDTLNPEAVDAMNALGVRMFSRKETSAGIAFMERSVQIARAIGDTVKWTTQLLRLAPELHESLMQRSFDLLDSAEQLAQSLRDTSLWSTVLITKGSNTYNRTGQYDPVSALNAAELMNAWSGYAPEQYAAAISNAIVVCSEQHRYQELDRIIDGMAVRAASRPGDSLLFGTLMLNRSLQAKVRHDNEPALAYATRAYNLYKSGGLAATNPSAMLQCYVILTAMQNWAGDHESLVRTATEGLADPALNGSQHWENRSMLLNNLANGLMDLGEFVEAAAVFLSPELLDEHSQRHRGLNNLGRCYHRMGRFESSDSCFNVILKEEPSRSTAGLAYYNLGAHALSRGNAQGSEQYLLKALCSYGIHCGPPNRPLILPYDADSVDVRFDVLSAWCRALVALLPSRSEQDVYRHELLANDSVFRLHVDTLLRTTRDVKNRTGLLELMTESLDRSIRALLTDDHVDWQKVLQLMELRRDHRWRSMMRSDGTSLKFGVPPALYKQDRDLAGLLETTLRNAGTDRSHDLNARIIQLRDSAMRVAEKIREIAPGYFAALNGLGPVDLVGVLAELKAGECILVLHSDTVERSITSIALGEEGAIGQRRPIDPVLLQTLAKGGLTRWNDLDAGAVAEAVFSPLATTKPPQHVIILPDGPLWNIPFDLLYEAWEHRDGAPPVFRQSTSMSAIPGVRRGMEPTEPELLAFAPDYAADNSNGANERGGPRAIPLVSNRSEVDEITGLCSGKAYMGPDANELLFRRIAPQASVVHLAMHAFLDPLAPVSSYMLFDVQSTDTVDGKLTIAEIHDLRLNADLAVLSACETGIGAQEAGEGVNSLARAFRYAGVPNTVSSLWKVDDRATKEIMVKFYEHLADGMGKADALAEAKRWYRRTYPNEPPSKWAAFILIGDNEPVRLKKRSPVKPWMIVLGAIVLVGAAWAYRQRTSRKAA